jgi:hypothetical protein
MNRKTWLLLTLALGIAPDLLSGTPPAAADESLGAMKGQVYYLACNLHPDGAKNTLSSINYQLDGGLLPWGTEVKVVAAGRRGVKMQDVKTNVTYDYQFHKRTVQAGAPDEHVRKILTRDINSVKNEINKLPALDQQGIKEGRVKKGMTRKGTLIALCPPPEFATPDPMNADAWDYWYDRYRRFVVHFGANGKVEKTPGYPFSN